MSSSTAVVLTSNASRYLQQLCKHWAHHMTVEFDETHGQVIFAKNARGGDWPGDGRFTMDAQPGALRCRITATAPGQLAGLKQAVEMHLNRFAFREGHLDFNWVND